MINWTEYPVELAYLQASTENDMDERTERMTETLIDRHGFRPPAEPTIDDHNPAEKNSADG